MFSLLFMILLLVTLIGLYYKQIFGLFGAYAILTGVVFVIAGFGIGYLLGWPKPGDRLAMGFMHGSRNLSVAVIAAGSVFSDQPNVMLMIAIMAILMLGILIPVSALCKIKPGPAAKMD